MATHSSILAWKIPWTEELGRLQSMGSQKSWTQLSDINILRLGTVNWKAGPSVLPTQFMGELIP